MSVYSRRIIVSVFVVLALALALTFIYSPAAKADTIQVSRIHEGKLFHTGFPGISLESGYNAVTGIGGTVVVNGGVCDIDSAVGVGAYVVADYSLPTDKEYVVRTKAHINNNTGLQPVLIVFMNDTTPNQIYTDVFTASRRRPQLRYAWMFAAACDAWATIEYQLSLCTYNQDYIWEMNSDGTNNDAVMRNTDGSLIASHGFAWGSAESPDPGASHLWASIGCMSGPPDDLGNSTDNTHDYFQAYESDQITVEELDSGNAVRLYDHTAALIDQDVETGGVATLDMDAVSFNTNTDTSEGGFRGEIKVYKDNTYSNLLTTYSAEDIWGGDRYVALPAPTVTSITPDWG